MTDDLISRQAAIDMFQSLADDDWNKGVGTSWAEAYSEAAEMIWDLPAAHTDIKIGKWIPCSERLPQSCSVLCCDHYGEIMVGYPYEDEESNTGFSAEDDDRFMIDCVAWMPLPEPYKEDADD